MDPDHCTLDTCPIENAYIHYRPTIPGNTIYLALFGVLLVTQLIQAFFFRLWGFAAAMATGLILEVAGYIGRILQHGNPFGFDYFLLNLICLSLGPVFFCAALYLLLGQIILIYHGQDVSRLKPRNYAIVFISCDVIALILQSAGGAMTSAAEDADGRQTGLNIMIAGLAFQVVALTLFIALASEFAIRLRRRNRKGGYQSSDSASSRKDNYAAIREKKTWKLFLFSLVVATVLIYTRSIFRVAELNSGYDGELANDEVTFMILEGALVSIACLGLTIMHPGMYLASRTKRKSVAEDVAM